MKRGKFVVCCALAAVAAIAAGACTAKPGDSEKAQFTVTFRQSGYEDVIKFSSGGAFDGKEIPATQPRTGYTVTWEEVDLSNVRADVVVNAVETPNEYTITYDLENKEGATISSTTQTVTYDAPYNLYQPTCEGYTFSGWKRADNGKTFENGTYTLTENITLIAVWEEEEEESWTKFY